MPCSLRALTTPSPRRSARPSGSARDGRAGCGSAPAPCPLRHAHRLSHQPLLRRDGDDDAARGRRLARLRADGIGVPSRADRHRPVPSRARPHAGRRRARRRARTAADHADRAGGRARRRPRALAYDHRARHHHARAPVRRHPGARVRQHLRRAGARRAAPDPGAARGLPARRHDRVDQPGAGVRQRTRGGRAPHRGRRHRRRLRHVRGAHLWLARRPRLRARHASGRPARGALAARDPRGALLRPPAAGGARLHGARHVRGHLRRRGGAAADLRAGDPARRAARLRAAQLLARDRRARDARSS